MVRNSREGNYPMRSDEAILICEVVGVNSRCNIIFLLREH